MNGFLSLSELQIGLSQSGLSEDDIKQLFSLLDTNGDESVDHEEFSAGFAKYEALAQGGVSARELLRQWSAGKPSKLTDSASRVQCCPVQGCPVPAQKVGLMLDEPRRVVLIGCSGSGKS